MTLRTTESVAHGLSDERFLIQLAHYLTLIFVFPFATLMRLVAQFCAACTWHSYAPSCITAAAP
jgi:hypothetical protein